MANQKDKRAENVTQTFVKGAFILSLAGLIAKILSAFFRIPLGNLIGDTGMGYYQSAYPVYTLLTTIATAGVPATLAKMVAEKRVLGDYEAAQDIFKNTLKFMAVMGVVLTATILLGSSWMLRFFGWAPETIYSLWGLGLIPVIVCLLGVFRGYFQGRQEMLPIAIAQVLENTGRVVVGLSLAFFFFPHLGHAAGGASFGGVVGGALALILLMRVYKKQLPSIKKEIQESSSKVRLSFSEVVKKVCELAIPIAIGSGGMAVITFLDSAFVIQTLTQKGMSVEVANQSFGQLGKISTFINLPLTFGMALVTGLIPAIAEAVARKDKKEIQTKVELGIRIAILIALPASVGLAVLSKPIMRFIYANAPSGALLLTLSAIGLTFMIITQIFIGILQGVGKVWQPVIGIILAGLTKAVLVVVLVASPLEVGGAALSTIIAYMIFAIYTYFAMKKYTGYQLNKNLVVMKPLLSSVVMGIVTFGAYSLLRHPIGEATLLQNATLTLIGVTVGGSIYLMMLFVVGALTKQELNEMLNKKEK
ncbi:putative polysaccharide biosynthesis protein [Sporanaerobium hydrogeniformans]|uniref:putative polysaccharide biosynthesis protein n=1 Tax=Sporanaerobium hydrogeniformans TaxID=3072179 RepID=UPI0015D478F3|nr:polysaccharide biosynthesis protein [Sporanaerobium hydrogeniformans]